MIQDIKREYIIAQLVELEVYEIDGQPLRDVPYKLLVKTLAVIRALDS